MSAIELSLAGALALGAYSTVHCGAMCGGLAAALPARELFGVVVGRLGGYALLGGVAGALGGRWQTLAADVAGAPLDWRWPAGVLLCALGLYAGWRGRRPSGCGGCGGHCGGARHRSWLLGMAWAVLPCPTLYLTAAAAMLLGSPGRSAAFMAVFALATTPALLLPRWLLHRGASALGGPGIRVLSGGLLLASAAALPGAAAADWCRRLLAG